MSKKAKFKSLAAKMIKKSSGDIAKSATFVFNYLSEFDYELQESVPVYENVKKVFVLSYEDREFLAKGSSEINVAVGDLKMFLCFDDISNEPKFSDNVIIENKTYVIKNVKLDAAEAAYEIRLGI